MRAVARQPWSKIRDTLGFGSVGAAQMAYRRFLARNPVPDGKTVFAEIIERKRVTTGALMSALAHAQKAADHQTVATLVRAINNDDAELAKLYGLGSETVKVEVHQSMSDVLAEAEARLLAMVDERSRQRELSRNVIEGEVVWSGEDQQG
jgi:hypothetical protein